jgi:predicted nucleotidyltransferase
MKKRNPLMVDSAIYSRLVEYRSYLQRSWDRKVNVSQAIEELLRVPLFFVKLDNDIRDYLDDFVSSLCINQDILGIVLFGSVARNNFSQFSDIDVLVVSKLSFLDSLNYIEKIVDGLEPIRKELLVSRGKFLNISPLILSPSDLETVHPLLFDIADQGIILFERYHSITNFINRVRKIKHTRDNEKEIIEWTV